jgi:hypothetical protein
MKANLYSQFCVLFLQPHRTILAPMFSPEAGSAKILIGTNTRSFSVSEYPRIEKLVFGRRKRRPLLAGALIALCINSASAKPAFVQANYEALQVSRSLVAVSYTNAQIAGDVNVVVVGWNDTTARINSVTDTAGNIYQLAIGPTQLSGTASQSIYYAKQIVGAPARSLMLEAPRQAPCQIWQADILTISLSVPTMPPG